MESVLSFLFWLFYLLIGLIGTGIVIFIHELGHYIVARMFRVNVEILSFGFGPTLFSHMGKNTEFRISAIPFGGYCRLGGAEDLSVALANNRKKIKLAEEGSLFAINPFKKLFIYIAGPLTNLILAYLLFFIVALIPVERISNEAVVTPISEYSTLFDVEIEQPELKKGDRVLYAEGKEIKDYEELSQYLSTRNGENVEAVVLRNGEETTITLVPTLVNGNYSYGITNIIKPVIGRSEDDRINTGDRIIECNGVRIENNLDLLSIDAEEYNLTLIDESGERKEVTLSSKTFPFAFASNTRVSRETASPFSYSYEKTKTFLVRTTKAIMKLMTLQFSEALKEISGPFSSASNMGRISLLAFKTSSSSGVRTSLYLLAIVSISICIGNLIPIPNFDGGQMLISFAEIIYRRPLRPRAYLILHAIGLVLAWTIVIIMNSYSYIVKLFS